MYLEGSVPARQQAAVRKFFLARFDALAPGFVEERPARKPEKKAGEAAAAMLDQELLVAVANSQWARARKLVERGANAGRPARGTNKTALFATLREGSFGLALQRVTKSELGKIVSLALLMLERGANPNIEGAGGSGNVLEQAIAIGSLELVKACLAKGAKVKPTHLKAEDPEILKLLKKHEGVGRWPSRERHRAWR